MTKQELKRIAEQATPGPWKVEDHRDHGDWRTTGLIWQTTDIGDGGSERALKKVCQVDWNLLKHDDTSEFEGTVAFISTFNPQRVLALLAEIEAKDEVLSKIADPRKRDHKEPDAYTELGCVMNMASEVLAKYSEEK